MTSLGDSLKKIVDGCTYWEEDKETGGYKQVVHFERVKQYPAFDPRLPVVCFDFDGVLASAKWPKPEIGEVDPEAKEAVEWYASRGCEVVVCSARPASHHQRIWKWLEEQGLGWAIYDVTNVKPVASLYFDDRAVRWPLA